MIDKNTLNRLEYQSYVGTDAGSADAILSIPVIDLTILTDLPLAFFVNRA